MSKPLRLVPQPAQPIEFCCSLCSSNHAAYIFGTDQFRIFRCGGCGLTFSKPRQVTEMSLPARVSRASDRDEADHASLLASLESAAICGQVLLLADPQDGMVALLQHRGITIGRIIGEQDFGPGDWGATFDAVIVSNALMRVSDPRAALTKIRKHLAPGAPLLASIPLLDGKQAQLMGRSWHEWQSANLWYFTRETLNLLLLSTGFERVWFRAERRSYSIDRLSERIHGIAQAASWHRGVEALRQVLPQRILRHPFRLPSGTAVVSAVAAPLRAECVLSIVVPVFNEVATFRRMMDGLLGKHLSGIRKQIIVVESNSTDGSRDLVRSYEGQSGVQIVLQSSPRGKGHAVREGLRLATGDIVMIQDADLEYDLDDYDGLLAPLLAWQAMFILGSRHQGGWKMRKFNDAPVIAAFFNFGHWFFKSALNLALNSRMTDPFTMFKVFRRDALYGIDFLCNRFDFDIELVMKLVRKGYMPVELPVNYAARSFAEGKKISVLKDGCTWLWTILRFRMTSIGRDPAGTSF